MKILLSMDREATLAAVTIKSVSAEKGRLSTMWKVLTFHVYGTSEAAENVKTGSVKIFGEAEVKGNMEAEDTLVMGTMMVGGNAHLNKIKIFGLLEVGERLTGDEANIKGSICSEWRCGV